MASISQIIEDVYEIKQEGDCVIVADGDIKYKDANSCRGFLNIPFNSNEFELPLLGLEGSSSKIQSIYTKNLWRPDNILIPLYYSSMTTRKRTMNSILHSMFIGCDYAHKLSKIETSSGIYYGGKGIILDSNFNLILLLSFACTIVSTTYSNEIKFIHPVCHVDNSVFTNQSNIINKCIIKKIIPYLVENKIYTPVKFLHECRRENTTIHLGNLNDKIVQSVPPKSIENLQSDIGDILNSNKDQIVKDIFSHGCS